MIIIVDNNRQHVANFVGQDIGSNSIDAKYQPPIVSFSKADALESSDDTDSIKLDVLSVNDTDTGMSAKSWRLLAESQLKALGRSSVFRRSIA